MPARAPESKAVLKAVGAREDIVRGYNFKRAFGGLVDSSITFVEAVASIMAPIPWSCER